MFKPAAGLLAAALATGLAASAEASINYNASKSNTGNIAASACQKPKVLVGGKCLTPKEQNARALAASSNPPCPKPKVMSGGKCVAVGAVNYNSSKSNSVTH